MIETRVCTKCSIEQDVSEFNLRSGSGSYRSHCKFCVAVMAKEYRKTYLPKQKKISREWMSSDKGRDTRLRRVYGITLDEYNDLLAEQGGNCAVCGCAPSEKKMLSVDHNHDTGDVRGLLCQPCNTAIGMLGDNDVLLLAAARYLDSSGPIAAFWG